jgi:hypothetical protein
MANTTVSIKISPRERLMLCGFLSQNAKSKGAVEERALVDAFDAFGLTLLMKTIGETNVWGASEEPETVEVSTSSLKLVLDALNGDAQKAPLQTIILRPLADELAKALAN